MSPEPQPIRSIPTWLGLALLLALAVACNRTEGSQTPAETEACCDEEKAGEQAVAAAAQLQGQSVGGIPDALLTDQNGKQVRLYSDLIKGRKVVANFVFTTCATVCPTLQTVFEGVQKRLGDRLGKDVVMLSITVDPANDTPERMRAFAEDHHAKPGWYFLTGSVEDIRDVLLAFNVYTAKKEEHTALFVIGNEPAGRWMYQSGLVEPSVVVKQVELIGKEQ